MTTNPYEELPGRAFWRRGVAEHNMLEITELWQPALPIAPSDCIVTYGSCFAQHIGRALRERGYGWMSFEPPPFGLSDDHATTCSYGIFSSRTGNIYTTSLLHQWTRWALSTEPVPDEVWNAGERFFDPWRPRVEPDGFASADDVVRSRRRTVEAFRDSIVDSDVFVFTLGLTESWVDLDTGHEYPMCPGTAAGTFDPSRHVFHNMSYPEVESHLLDAMTLMLQANPRLRFLLTVSPVPLTATMSDRHVVVATMASKSILRAVADATSTRADTDYFPSYEIINSPVFKGVFFEPNQRNVARAGVDFVMRTFFRCLTGRDSAGWSASKPDVPSDTAQSADDACEEALLEAFGS